MTKVFTRCLILLCMAVAVLLGLHQGLSLVAFSFLLPLLGATFIATPVQGNNNWKTWNITCQDADTTTTFAHGFGAMPDAAWVQMAASTSTTLVNSWGMTAGATNITVTKLAATDSGGPVPGTSVAAKVFAWRPHSAAR